MITVEITGAVDAAGTQQTFYLSTDPIVTTPSDTPANTAFQPVLMDPGSFGIHAFGDGRTGGATSLEVGEVVLANSDGRFDAWKDYAFDGRPIVIRYGDGGAYPSSFTVLFQGTVELVEVTWTKAVIRLRDKQLMFQVPLLPNTYAGTNTLPNGIEGTANDIKGQKKPRVYGRVYNTEPPCVNTSLLIFQVSDRAVNSIDAVYDRGLALTPGADFATNALLQAQTGLTAGTYITCKAEGLFRLASNPTGAVTCDATEGATSSVRTVAQILSRMAIDAGLSGSYSTADVTTMDAANASEVGIWVTDVATFQESMDAVAGSIGAYYGFDGSGVLRLAVLTAPSGSPVLTLQEHHVLSGIERVTPSDKAIPPWAVVVNHSKIYAVQDTDVAGAVTNARREFLKSERRSVRAEDAAVKTKYKLAAELTFDTMLADVTGATALAEANRLLTLYKTNPLMFDVPLDLSTIQGTSLRMMDVVSLQLNRFGMSAGRLFKVIGFKLELSRNQVILSLWG